MIFELKYIFYIDKWIYIIIKNMSSKLITNKLKEISTLINEIQEKKRTIYLTNDQNQISQSLKIIKLKLSDIDDKVIK